MPFEDHDYPQVIPTPPYAAPGREAPWSKLSLDERSRLTLRGVSDALRSSGRHFEVAQPPESSRDLSGFVSESGTMPIVRRSAVLVVLFEEDGETRVILTRRSIDLKSHRGEVALPGGRSDEGETASQTALREAHEEIGLDPNSVEITGWLSPIVTFASGSAIQPVVGLLERRPQLRANPHEVERIFDVALAELLEEGNFLEQRWRRESPRPKLSADGTFPIYFYRVPGEVIWGATGRVLTELLAIVTGTIDAMEGGPVA